MKRVTECVGTLLWRGSFPCIIHQEPKSLHFQITLKFQQRRETSLLEEVVCPPRPHVRLCLGGRGGERDATERSRSGL